MIIMGQICTEDLETCKLLWWQLILLHRVAYKSRNQRRYARHKPMHNLYETENHFTIHISQQIENILYANLHIFFFNMFDLNINLFITIIAIDWWVEFTGARVWKVYECLFVKFCKEQEFEFKIFSPKLLHFGIRLPDLAKCRSGKYFHYSI